MRTIATVVCSTFLCSGTWLSAASVPSLSIQLLSGAPQLNVRSPTNGLCQVQYLETLGGTKSWSHFTSLLVNSNPCVISDIGSSDTPTRFYRIKMSTPSLSSVTDGSFAMGDAFNELGVDEVPVHTATVTGFQIDSLEVSKALWDIVYAWATNHGYDFAANAGAGKAATHPVQMVNWYDAVKWCNARSQLEGLNPCYYTNDTFNGLYIAGQTSLSNGFVNWGANGYRLPTEAEWERAARGGGNGLRFPWSGTNVISHSRANYRSNHGYTYDVSPTEGFHPAFTNGPTPYTSPCGYFAPNGYGLYDMAGNVLEWCWDRYDAGWYTNTAASLADTPGPDAGTKRVIRGGSWEGAPPDCSCAIREGKTPSGAVNELGFRCVRGH